MTAFNYPREGFSRVERRGETRKIKGHGDNATVPSLSFSPFFFSSSLPVSVPAGSQRPVAPPP